MKSEKLKDILECIMLGLGDIVYFFIIMFVVQVIIYFYKIGQDGITVLNMLVEKVYGT